MSNSIKQELEDGKAHIRRLEAELDVAKIKEKFGDYPQYLTMPIEQLEKKYNKLSTKSYALCQILALRKAASNRAGGIDCHCDGIMMCKYHGEMWD